MPDRRADRPHAITRSWCPARPRCSTRGAHGLSELLYAYGSAETNNGSAFAGITATWFQSSLGAAMALGRFVPMLATLALAGSLAAQQKVPRPRAPCRPPVRCSGRY